MTVQPNLAAERSLLPNLVDLRPSFGRNQPNLVDFCIPGTAHYTTRCMNFCSISWRPSENLEFITHITDYQTAHHNHLQLSLGGNCEVENNEDNLFAYSSSTVNIALFVFLVKERWIWSKLSKNASMRQTPRRKHGW